MTEQARPLEQLYYTWSTIGFGNITGYQVRAATEGLADINSSRFRDLANYLRYSLPSGTDSYQATQERSPHCLIYSFTGKEHILAHKIYVGRDGYNNRGNYFVHLLAGLPESFAARDAIDLWRSDFWDTTDRKAENTRTLPQVPLSALASSRSTINEQNLLRTQDFVKQFLPLVIQAYLSTEETSKLYIAGTSDLVALLIWGLTHCLPRTMQHGLTFSTYERERDILTTPARIVGTCHPQTDILKGYIMPPQLIPPDCYSKGLVIDCYTGKHSDLSFVSTGVIEFAQYATTYLLEGEKKRTLESMLSSAEEDGVKDTEQLLSFLRLNTTITRSESLTPREIIGLVTNKRSIAKNLRAPGAQQAIIALALQEPKQWDKTALPAIQALRTPLNEQGQDRKDVALRSFGIRIALELYGVMVQKKASDVEVCGVIMPTKVEATKALKQLLLDVAPTEPPPSKAGVKPWDNTPWVHLLESFADHLHKNNNFHPTLFDWKEGDNRSWFLQQWAFAHCIYAYELHEVQQQKANGGNSREPLEKPTNAPLHDAMIIPWLQLRDWDEFLALLEIEHLPERWCQLAFIYMLTRLNGAVPKAVITLFNQPTYYALFIGALMHMVQEGQQAIVINFFSTLAQSRFRGLALVLATLLGAGTLKPKEVDALFAVAKLNTKEKVQLLENYYQQLLPGESQGKAPVVVVEIIEAYLGRLTLNALTNKTVGATLKHLFEQQHKLPQSIGSKLQHWVLISDILSVQSVPEANIPRLALNPNYLTNLAAAIHSFQLQSEKKYRERLFLLFIANIKTLDDLHCVLEYLSPTFGDDGVLFRELVACMGRYNTRFPFTKFLPYIEEALIQAATISKNADKEKYLLPIFKDLFHNNWKVFDAIDVEISPRWPDYIQQHWELFAGKIRPRRFSLPTDGKKVLGAVGDMAKDAVVKGKERLRQPSPSAPGQQTTTARDGNVENASSNNNQPEQSPEPTGEALGARKDPQISAMDGDMGENGSYYINMINARRYDSSLDQPPAGRSLIPPQNKSSVLSDPSLFQHSEDQRPDIANDFVAPYQQRRGLSEPQSIVNGVPISVEQIVQLFRLKDIYIRLRYEELAKASEYAKKHKIDNGSILDEMDELGEHTTIEYSQRVLENDVLIENAITQYGSSPNTVLDPKRIIEQYTTTFTLLKQQRDYLKVLGKYSDFDMRRVLQVFLRYRMLAAFFREQDNNLSMREWLEKQRSVANIKPSYMPLPDIQ